MTATKLVKWTVMPCVALHRKVTHWLATILHSLALHFLNNHDYRSAEIAFKAIISIDPDNRASIFELVHLYIQQALYQKAIILLHWFLQGCPEDVEGHRMLSVLYMRTRHLGLAWKHIDLASRLDSSSASVMATRGALHRVSDDLPTSEQCLRAALRQHTTPQALFWLAETLIDQGAMDQATDVLEQAIEIAPDFYPAYVNLSRCGHYKDALHPHIAYMKDRLANGKFPAYGQIAFNFALGAAFDSLRLWDTAFAYFRAGNELKRRRSTFNLNAYMKYSMREIDVFNRQSIERSQGYGGEDKGEFLIFIVGMPRSGSTLVEQILASHPDVQAGGETGDINRLIAYLSSQLRAPYPDCALRLDKNMKNQLIRVHLGRVYPLAHLATRFVDKSLCNFQKIGFIASLFPKAKFINCQRNVLDTCLSCYFTDFENVQFSHDLKILRMVYQVYERFLDHWRAILPGQLLDIQHEEMVNDPDVNIRRLLTYCELPWYEGCLRPHKTLRVVRTASAMQVRQPINNRSVGRWRNYYRYFEPLL